MKRLCTIGMVTSAVLVGAQSQQQVMIGWPHTGSEQSQSKYSAATDITPSNVSRLALAWQWRPNEAAVTGWDAAGELPGDPPHDR